MSRCGDFSFLGGGYCFGHTEASAATWLLQWGGGWHNREAERGSNRGRGGRRMCGGGKGGGEGWEENRQSGGKPHAVAVFERSAEQRPHLSLSPSLWCFGFLFCAPVLTKKRDLAARVFLVIDLQSLFWCGYTWIPMVMVKEKGIPAVMTVCVCVCMCEVVMSVLLRDLFCLSCCWLSADRIDVQYVHLALNSCVSLNSIWLD